jgi:hypothetical protein
MSSTCSVCKGHIKLTAKKEEVKTQVCAQPAGSKQTWFERAAAFVFLAILLFVVLLVVERVFFPSMYFNFKDAVVGYIDNQPYHASIGRYLRANAQDPSSVSIVSLNPAARAANGTLMVDCHYRAKNGFGALVLDSETFVVDGNNNVISATHY